MDYSLLLARILYVILLIVCIIFITAFISYILSGFSIDITEYTITSSKIPDAFNGYKILQLSDLHNASYGKNNSKLLKKIEKINPDIIVMTGDMVNTNSKNYNNFYSLAKEISSKYPSYYILGNHELRLSAEKRLDILYKLNSFGVNVLNNSSASLLKDNEIINIYGLTQPITTYKNVLKNNVETDFSLEDIQSIFQNIDNNSFNILLSHSPFDFEIFSKWGADLVLSGHIHGGIIRLPLIGGLLSPERNFFPKYDAGEFSYSSSKMVVSRGLGNGTINLRIFNNPEICVIKLNNDN